MIGSTQSPSGFPHGSPRGENPPRFLLRMNCSNPSVTSKGEELTQKETLPSDTSCLSECWAGALYRNPLGDTPSHACPPKQAVEWRTLQQEIVIQLKLTSLASPAAVSRFPWLLALPLLCCLPSTTLMVKCGSRTAAFASIPSCVCSSFGGGAPLAPCWLCGPQVALDDLHRCPWVLTRSRPCEWQWISRLVVTW